jgi:nitrate reductase gamma subunit
MAAWVTWVGQVFGMTLGTLDGQAITLGSVVVVILIIGIVLMVYGRIAGRK